MMIIIIIAYWRYVLSDSGSRLQARPIQLEAEGILTIDSSPDVDPKCAFWVCQSTMNRSLVIRSFLWEIIHRSMDLVRLWMWIHPQYRHSSSCKRSDHSRIQDQTVRQCKLGRNAVDHYLTSLKEDQCCVARPGVNLMQIKCKLDAVVKLKDSHVCHHSKERELPILIGFKSNNSKLKIHSDSLWVPLIFKIETQWLVLRSGRASLSRFRIQLLNFVQILWHTCNTKSHSARKAHTVRPEI